MEVSHRVKPAAHISTWHPPAPHMLHLVLREKLMVNCTQNQWKDTKEKWIILQDTRVDCNLVTVRVIACSCLVRTAPSVQFLQSYIVTRLVSFFDISLSLSLTINVSIINYFGDKVLYIRYNTINVFLFFCIFLSSSLMCVLF